MGRFAKSIVVLLITALALSNTLPFLDEPAMRGIESSGPGLILSFVCAGLLVFSHFALLAYVSLSAMADEIVADVSIDDAWGHLVYGMVATLLTLTLPLAAIVIGNSALAVAATILSAILSLGYLIAYLPYKALNEYPLRIRAPPLGLSKSILAGIVALVGNVLAGLGVNLVLMLLGGLTAPLLYFRGVRYPGIVGASYLPENLPIWSWGDVVGVIITAVILRSLYDILKE